MERYSVKDLKSLAKERKIKGWYNMRKAELINALSQQPTVIGSGEIPCQNMQKCVICRLYKDLECFSTKKSRPSKSSINCNLIKAKEVTKRKENELHTFG